MGRLAGAIQPGDRVVVTEDTTTRGTSLMEAVEVVREFGAEVVLVTLIVDRGDTCAALCAEAGVPYRPLLRPPISASTRAIEGEQALTPYASAPSALHVIVRVQPGRPERAVTDSQAHPSTGMTPSSDELHLRG